MTAAIDVSLVVIMVIMVVFFGFTCAYVAAHSKMLFSNDGGSGGSGGSTPGRIVPYRPVYGARGPTQPNPTNDVVANILVNHVQNGKGQLYSLTSLPGTTISKSGPQYIFNPPLPWNNGNSIKIPNSSLELIWGNVLTTKPGPNGTNQIVFDTIANGGAAIVQIAQ